MNAQPVPAAGLNVEIIHGGDAASHQRRVQEWLTAMAAVLIVDIQHSAIHEPNSRTGVSFSTMILYREA